LNKFLIIYLEDDPDAHGSNRIIHTVMANYANVVGLAPEAPRPLTALTVDLETGEVTGYRVQSETIARKTYYHAARTIAWGERVLGLLERIEERRQ